MKWKRYPARLVDDMMARRWSQADVARAAGVTEKSVSRFVRGEPIGIAQVGRIADAMNRPLKYYLDAEVLNVEESDSEPQAKPASDPVCSR